MAYRALSAYQNGKYREERIGRSNKLEGPDPIKLGIGNNAAIQCNSSKLFVINVLKKKINNTRTPILNLPVLPALMLFNCLTMKFE